MTKPVAASAEDIRRLEEKIEALLNYCEHLRAENETLNALMLEWMEEKGELSEQTAVAKKRVTAMISRLKSMGYKT